MAALRWLFADQLGGHFLGGQPVDDPQQEVLLVESLAVLRRRRYHRAKAHLVLSALRHRAAELGDRATLIQAETYRDALSEIKRPIEVIHPTSRAALGLVQSMPQVTILPPRGFVTTRHQFAEWVESRGGRRLLLEDFYRSARRRTGVLMEGTDPVGGRWNFDALNREPPPKSAGSLGLPEPWWPAEDEIDDRVRFDLDASGIEFVGRDGPRRFAATQAESAAVLADFVTNRLPLFGRYEDAMMSGDPWMAHSLLSAPMNLGLVDPATAIAAAVAAHRQGSAPLPAVEGFVRQIMGWRDYVWHLYWHFGEGYPGRNELEAHEPLPRWFAVLDADTVGARCLGSALAHVRDYGWAHHIERLMVLGSWALQRGISPAELLEWFRCSFVDGYDWVMAANVIGMSQYADGGLMATKPYTSGGAYIKKMGNFCSGCDYRPERRKGPQACPFTVGYWAFLVRNSERLSGNHRMAQPLASMKRLADLAEVVALDRDFGTSPP